MVLRIYDKVPLRSFLSNNGGRNNEITGPTVVNRLFTLP